MGDHYRGSGYLFLLGRGVVLATVSSVGDLASTLPCWEWFSFVVNSRCVFGTVLVCSLSSRCVFVGSRGLFGTVVGCWGDSWCLLVLLGSPNNGSFVFLWFRR